MMQPQDYIQNISPPAANMASSDRDTIASDRRETLLQQLAVARTVLSQAVDLVNNHFTSDEQLTVHSQYMPGSTIGMSSVSVIPRFYTECPLKENICVTRETTLCYSWNACRSQGPASCLTTSGYATRLWRQADLERRTLCWRR